MTTEAKKATRTSSDTDTRKANRTSKLTTDTTDVNEKVRTIFTPELCESQRTIADQLLETAATIEKLYWQLSELHGKQSYFGRCYQMNDGVQLGKLASVVQKLSDAQQVLRCNTPQNAS